jgi:two-component sensor histidine kinase
MPIDDTAGCFGVLELDRPYAREFNELEVGFISAIARLLGRAVARTREMEAMRLTNEALAAQLDESQTLLREIYHRVRNDLQSLEGCAYLGQRSASDPASKQAFGVLSRRLMSIAQLYDLLLVSAEPRVVAFDDYLGVLCARVRDAQDLAARGIVLDMTAGPVRLVQEQAVSFGIVANELMANAVEHAFTAQAEGTIQVRLSPCGAGSHRATLMICDDGSGMRSAPFGEGLSLAERLVAQHGGRMTHASGHGTSWTITMPCL